MKKFLLFVLLSFSLLASDGTLDPSFGGGAGFVFTLGDGIGANQAAICSVQTDGKIVVVGFISGGTASRIIRYNSDGSIDTSFAPPLNYIDTTAPEVYRDLLVQPDGKILVGGGNGTTAILRRYNSNGSIDTTFGNNGLVTGPFSSIINFKLQTDSKIVAAMLQGGGDNWAVVRYNADGSLDTIFTDISTLANPTIGDIAIQQDGKIVAVGARVSIGEPLVVRYNTNGSLDTSFGVGGLFIGFYVMSNVNGVGITDDGKIVAAGTSGANLIVFRVNSNGTLDTSFGTGGATTVPGGTVTRCLALQPDGKIMVGSTGTPFKLIRFTQDGALDTTSFAAPAGFTTTPPGFGRTVTPQSNGYTLFVGGDTGLTGFQIARYINSPAFTPVTITSPTSGSTINPGQITITGTAENLSFVYVFLDDVLLGGTATNSSNTWSFTTTISDTNSHTLRAVSIYMNHDLDMASNIVTLQSSILSFTGRFVCNKFLNKTERVVFASWQASPIAVLYKIYKKDKVICTITPNGSSSLSSTIFLQRCDQVSDFSISFVTSNGTESSRSALTIS